MAASTTITTVASVTALIMAGWALNERAGNQSLRADLTRAEAEANDLRTARTLQAARVAEVEAASASLETKLQVSEAKMAELAQAQVSAGPAGEKTKDEKNPMAKMMKGMEKMMSDPGMKDMIAAQIGSIMEGQYRDLLDEMGLDDGKRTALMKLLSERATAAQSAGMKMMSGGDKEALKGMSAEMEKTMKTNKDAIKALLGDEQHALYERYEDSQPERQRLTMLKSSLSEAPLSGDQEEKLMALMYSERKNAKFKHDYNDQTDFNFDKFNSKDLAEYDSQSQGMDQRVLEGTKSFLSPEQQEGFIKHQQQMNQMQKAAFQMVKGMLGEAE